MPISLLGSAKFQIRPLILKAHQRVVKRNKTPICKGLGVIERFSITGSGVMPISPLGGAKFEIRPHILEAHLRLPISG